MSGQSHVRALQDKNQVCIWCYWHQHHIYGAWYMRQLANQGMNIGFLISPSADGDMSAKLARNWGFSVIRGSSNRTGAKAMRDLYNSITKDHISPVNTSDGPTGPLHIFKPGAIMLAQLTGSPIILFSYAASRYWKLSSWDEFIIPKPFSRIAMNVSEAIFVEKKLTSEELEELQITMQSRLSRLQYEANEKLGI